MNAILRVLLVGVFLFDATAGAQWALWKTASPILMPPKLSNTYVRFTLEPDLDPTPDLRIVDENGTETPYVIDPDAHRASGGTQRETPLTNAEFVPNGFTQAVIDFGAGRTEHAAVLLDGGNDAFFHRVRVETSPDTRSWTLVRKDAYIYRVASDKSGNMIVSFPPTTARYVRLQILNSAAKFPLSGWSLSGLPPERGDTLVARPVRFSETSPPATPSKNVWTADFGRPVGASAVEFLNAAVPFARSVQVEAGPNGTDWHDAGTGTISNPAIGAPQTAFAFPEQRARFWRLTIDNGTHGPSLSGLAPRLLTRPHDVLFEPALNRSYVLLSNNDAATPPDYDLPSRLEREDWFADVVAIGPAGPNPAYENARPLLERYPWLLYLGGAVGIAGLGLLLLRIVRPRPRAKDVFEPPVKPPVR